jgi:hypothetical protein
MSKVRIVQCLCPERHCWAAVAVEARMLGAEKGRYMVISEERLRQVQVSAEDPEGKAIWAANKLCRYLRRHHLTVASCRIQVAGRELAKEVMSAVTRIAKEVGRAAA